MSLLQKNTSYEVQARIGSSWDVLDVYFDSKIAEHEALMAWNGGQHVAVRVVCETMDPQTSVFSSTIMQHFGAKDDGVQIGTDYSSRPCWNVDDLYTFESRQFIATLLQDLLETWRITPAELLHSPEHYFRIERAGTTLQSAVQRAAVQQVKASGQNVQDRIKALYAIIGEGIGKLSKLYKSGAIDDITSSNLDNIIAALSGKKDRNYVLSCLLANHLKDNTTIDDKLRTLLELVRPDHPEWVIEVVDVFISGFLNHASVVMELIGGHDNLAASLLEIAHLAGGRSMMALSEDGKQHIRLVRINSMLASRELPDTRRILLTRIVKEIEGGRKLVGDNLEDELKAMNAIAAVMDEQSKRHADTHGVINAISERAGRFITEYYVASHIQGAKTPIESIGKILDLELILPGEESKRKLANFIMPIVRAQEHIRFFEAADGRHLERMQQIAQLQNRVSKSGLMAFHKQRVMTKLDDQCMALIAKAKLFSRAHDTTALGKKLLTMLMEGYFTQGEALKLAQKEIRRILRQPGFIESYVDGGSQSDKVHRLITLKTALTKTGFNTEKHQKTA